MLLVSRLTLDVWAGPLLDLFVHLGGQVGYLGRGFREGLIGPIGVFDGILEFGNWIRDRSQWVLDNGVWQAAD
jgi:hypothetical protein